MTAPTVEATAATGAGSSAASARAVQAAISAAAMRDAAKLWPLLDPKRLDQTWPAWLRAMILLTKTYHSQSSTAAGRSYRLMRARATQSPAPSSLIKTAEAPSEEWMSHAYGFSGPGQLAQDTARPNTALSTTLGTTSRIVLDGGRTTTFQTIQADPVALGWYRITDGRPCAFCALLASRGAVYKEHSFEHSNSMFEGPGEFKVHNLCGCSMVPLFSRDEKIPAVNAQALGVYWDSLKDFSGPRNPQNVLPLFRKAWAEHLAAHPE